MATVVDNMGQLENENNVSSNKLETATGSSDLASDNDANIYPDSFVGKDGTELNSEPCIKGRTAARNIVRGLFFQRNLWPMSSSKS